MDKIIEQSLTFDDVLLEPSASDFLPSQADVSTLLTKKIKLSIPIISSAMDTVTTSQMAIALAQEGGIGCIHKNMSIEEQSAHVLKVKKYEAGIVCDPITINPETTLRNALSIMIDNKISGLPVVEKKTGILLGILTNRDVRFAKSMSEPISNLMTRDNLITVRKGISETEAKKLLHQYRIEKLIVVDENYRCIGLITVKDLEKARQFPNSCKDSKGRLRVAAAIGVGDTSIERARALIDAEVDVIIVDTAHGESKFVIDTVNRLKKYNSKIEIIGGNIATAAAAEALIGAGADAVKVGVGPGSICTTRVIAGVGVPQLTAIMNAAKICKKHGIKLIADGGIKYSGDIAKAIAAGADTVMIGSLFAGTSESPGEVELYHGRAYKTYRGMGSISAMQSGSADRYFQSRDRKLVPEGVEGRVPYKGHVTDVIHQLVGGLKSAMGYTGNKTIKEMQENTKMVRITNAGLRESHPHDITITKEAPNYSWKVD